MIRLDVIAHRSRAKSLVIGPFLILAGCAHEWPPPEVAALQSKPRMCDKGTRQSPVAMEVSSERMFLHRFQLDYGQAKLTWGRFLGDRLAARIAPGPALSLDGDRFRLVAVEIRHPAEHNPWTRSSEAPDRYAAEMHFINTNEKGEVLILAVFLLGTSAHENRAFDRLLQFAARRNRGDPGAFDATELVPANADPYWVYDGSLTDPPCTEGVRWIVLGRPVRIAAGQLRTIRERLKAGARPKQAPNGRRLDTSSSLPYFQMDL